MVEKAYAIPEILDSASGRLDALRVASFLQLSTEDLAAVLRCSQYMVLANPVAANIQEGLRMIAFVAASLLELTGGSKEQMHIWLTTPHPDFDDTAPLDLMREGELSVVVDMVDDMLSGAPA